MSSFPSQNICDSYPLSIESLILVCPFDYDRSIDLDSRIETARFEVGENWATGYESATAEFDK